MKVSTDDRCRIQSRELFEPNARYEGEVDARGRIVLTRLVKVEKRPRLIKPRLKNGLLVLDVEVDEVALDAQIRD